MASGFHREMAVVMGGGWSIGPTPMSTSPPGVQRLTRVETGEPLHMSLTDDRLFDNPWIYATQTGWSGLNSAEISSVDGIPATVADSRWWMISGDRILNNGKCSRKPCRGAG